MQQSRPGAWHWQWIGVGQSSVGRGLLDGGYRLALLDDGYNRTPLDAASRFCGLQRPLTGLVVGPGMELLGCDSPGSLGLKPGLYLCCAPGEEGISREEQKSGREQGNTDVAIHKRYLRAHYTSKRELVATTIERAGGRR